MLKDPSKATRHVSCSVKLKIILHSNIFQCIACYSPPPAILLAEGGYGDRDEPILALLKSMGIFPSLHESEHFTQGKKNYILLAP